MDRKQSFRIDHIGDLRAFEAVARLGSLSAAARDLGLALSVVSKRLSRLERSVGERLAERSTRSLRLTPAGEAFIEPCRTALRGFDLLEDRGDAPLRGRIRISASVAFAQRRLAPCLPAFLDRHPGVSVEVVASDRLIDLVLEGVDLALRQMHSGPHMPGESVAPDGHVLVASQAYLDRHGAPEGPEDLAAHRCLTVGQPAPRIWSLRCGRQRVEAPIHAPLTGTDGETAHAAALAGGGIAMKSVWDVLEDLETGCLIRVLPDWTTGRREIRALFPAPDHRPRMVRHLQHHIRASLPKLPKPLAHKSK